MAQSGPFNSGAAVGGAGVATANADSATVIDGLVTAVYVRYNLTPPAATTDVTIATVADGDMAPSRAILTITNAATDGWFDVRVQAIGITGAALAGVYVPIPISDYVNVTIAQANALDNVDVWFEYV